MPRRPATSFVVLTFAVLLASCGGSDQPVASPSCPPPGAGLTSEQCLRTELGVPPDAARTIIFSQSSHLDWDWLLSFDDYFTQRVEPIFLQAFGLLSQFHTAPAHYYYSVAEVGYLQRFAAAHPEMIEGLRQVGNDLRIVGGGITSPDNLLPTGEAFIRDYLVGKTWVDGSLGLPIRQSWLPDDFGHDAQLPVVLEAMGFQGVGFARVPGVDTSGGYLRGQPSSGSLAAELLAQGLDFVWQAADGSETLAHWMPQSYCQGDPLGMSAITNTAAIQRMIDRNGPASTTPYIFVPIGCDFATPNPSLLATIQAWNTSQYPRTGVWAVAATFDHYMQLVSAHRSTLQTRRFDPTPYWTGFYASKPLLKSLHVRATQALLGAEIFGAIADAAHRDDSSLWLQNVSTRTAAIHAGWVALVPSNHHDYITGTATDAVYNGEQLPRLNDALNRGEHERSRAMSEIAASVARQPGTEQNTVVVFNQLGFARRGVVEVADASAAAVLVGARMQASAEGTALLMAQVPSLGYAAAARAIVGTESAGSASLAMAPDGDSVVVENDFLRAVMRRDAGWGITSLFDKRSNAEVVAAGTVANAFVVYADDGGLYRFGGEMSGCGLVPRAADEVGGVATPLEAGPLRARFVAEVVADGTAFRKEYQLVAGEPFLRMLSSGSAPDGTSVMVQFPLAGDVDELVYGTAYHWHRKRIDPTADQLAFEATHDFVMPRSNGSARAAIFHAGVPAWAARADGVLVGTLWRNAPHEKCDAYGPAGSDPGEHTASYALRVLSGVTEPETGAQLREELGFNAPLLSAIAPASGNLPDSFSLASAAPEQAIITAAKAGTADPSELLLRVYQPTNTPLSTTVTSMVAERFPRNTPLQIRGRTALEADLPGSQAAELGLRGDPVRFSFDATRALTTLGIHASIRR